MIIMDSRENPKLKKYFGEEEISVEALPTGDYYIKDKGILIERKSIGDFLGSYISGHIQEQCEQMDENFETFYLFISGHFNYLAIQKMPYKYLSEKSCNKMKMHLLLSFPNLRILEFANDKQLIEGVIEMKKYSGSARHKELIRRQATSEDVYLSLLTSVRGISLRKAKAISCAYQNIWKLQIGLEKAEDKKVFGIKELNKSDMIRLKSAFVPEKEEQAEN